MSSMQALLCGLSTGAQSTRKIVRVGPQRVIFLLASYKLGREFKQYMAVAPFPNSSHSPEIGVKVQRPSNSCIQIWSLSAKSHDRDAGQMKCEMVLCLDNGPAFDLKWCPLPSHDEVCSPALKIISFANVNDSSIQIGTQEN